jgi:uncharacterized membrane protein
MSNWKLHPHVRSGNQLSFGERAADAVRNGMGSWAFVMISSCFLAVWMFCNGSKGFDPYPFILLNLILSCIAAMQGAILLIAARRADQVSSELALHTYNIDKENLDLTRRIAELTEQVHKLTRAVYNHMGVKAEN